MTLTETIAHAEAEERLMMDKYNELQQELSMLTENHKKACAESGTDPNQEDENAPIDPDFSVCIGRLPMVD